MLWISSMMITVLPTPAPPKRPTFPPLEDGPHAVLAQVLGHLQCEADLRTAGLLILRRVDPYRVIDLRQFPFGKFRIHDRSDHLDDPSLAHCALRYFSASAPPTMSINSLVMAACLVLL